MYWHHVRENSQKKIISNFLSKNQVFRTFLKKFKSDRSDTAYLDRSYQYLQLLYWHQVLEKSSRPSKMSFFGFILCLRESNVVFGHLKEDGSPDFAHFAYLDRSYQYLQLFYWHHVCQVSQIFFISNFWSNLGQIRPIYIKWHISGRVDLHGSVFMFKRSISIGVAHKPYTFPWKIFIFKILVLKNGRYVSPIFDQKSRLFDF